MCEGGRMRLSLIVVYHCLKSAQSGYNMYMFRNAHKYIIGIDEVGRGPIAGPVTVGAVLMPSSLSWENFEGLKDSKKLTEKKREEWFSKISEIDSIHYVVFSIDQGVIDSIGIVPAIRSALNQSINELINKLEIHPENCLVLLDGGLHAGDEFIHQETIIKGDEKECSIAIASIMAKVTRDREMVKFGDIYPEYGFDTHKGYGTNKHFESIKKFGLCDLHRRSFLKRL